MQCRTYIIVLSGDVANQGSEAEYAIAAKFVSAIRDGIQRARPGSKVQFVSVPGNHDCVLPQSEIPLRSALIEGLRPTLHTAKPDTAILNVLLERQQPYFAFAKELFEFPLTDTEKLCGNRLIEVPGGKILFTLYNTALLSQRHEEQGLTLPLEVLRSATETNTECSLSISVFHHPYYWLEPNDSIEFRNHIDRTSEIVLTGHQHVEHGFVKQNISGEIVFYSEGHVLQDPQQPGLSGFRVIVLDLEKESRRIVSYSWKKSMYLPTIESEWTSYCRQHSRSLAPSPSVEFLAKLSDSGIGLTHDVRGPLTLDTFFVYPEVSLRKAGSFDVARNLSGSSLLDYLTNASRVVVEGSAFSGKSALAQTVAQEWLRTRSFYPLLISGKALHQNHLTNFESFVDAETGKAYGSESVVKYRQLPLTSKALIVDDWEPDTLDGESKDPMLITASLYFGKVLLLTSKISYIEHFMGKLEQNTELANYDLLTIQPMSFVARGQLIDKWVSMELSRSSPEFSRRVEEAERLMDTVIGRNTLPSLPFIVLAILEASQHDREKLPDNGSFGYLYEVLITAALSVTVNNKPQLDRKYQFLALLAFQMFTDDLDAISVQRTKELLNDYAKSWIIKLDKDALLEDLEYARVLVKREGHYTFGYPHYFHYFLARHFKTNFKDPSVRNLLSAIIKGLNVGSNGTFLMFVVYLTNNDESLTQELFQISECILNEFEPSSFTDEVEFYNSKTHPGLEPSVEPDSIDLEQSRQERREAADIARQEQGKQQPSGQLNLFLNTPGYSDDLPLSSKTAYGVSCIEILGQILRNFTGALPGDQKLAILNTTYRLGLRIGRAVLLQLSLAAQRAREMAETDDSSDRNAREFQKQVEKFLSVLGQIIGGSVVSMISKNVGSAEIEHDAYVQTRDDVGRNNATDLLHLAITLDQAGPDEYPLDLIRDLHSRFKDNLFAQRVLADLVVANMYVFDIGRKTRQKVLSTLGIRAPNEAMLSKSNKRLR